MRPFYRLVKFTVMVMVAHIFTYFLAGIFAQGVLGVHVFYPPSATALPYLRDPMSAHVTSWLFPAQVVRGLLYALALFPFRDRLYQLGQLRGGLAITGILFLVGTLAAGGGLIEHFVFFTVYPAQFAMITFWEVLLQTLLLGQLCMWWALRWDLAQGPHALANPPKA